MPDPLFGRDDIVAGDPTAQSVNLTSLLQRLGVSAPQVRHLYEPLILPVAIVDAGQVTLSATEVPMVLGAPASTGQQTTPPALTVLADTAQLAAGNWDVTVLVSISNGGINLNDETNFVMARRNAANGADVWAQIFQVEQTPLRLRITLALNERVIVRTQQASGAGQIYQASIWTQGPF